MNILELIGRNSQFFSFNAIRAMKLSASVLFLCIILLAGFTLNKPGDEAIDEEVITIEFTSVDGTPVTFESSFLFKKAIEEDKIEKITGKTPVSIVGHAIAYGGIVRKIDGAGELKVIMYKGSNEHRTEVASGEGDVIFLSELGNGRRSVAAF